MYLVALFALWSLIAWIVLGWDRFPSAFRKWLPRVLLAAGLSLMAVAPFLEGRTTEDITLFIYPNPYVVETIERSYTGLAVGAGLVLLLLFALARWGDRLPGKGPLAQAFKLTAAVILLRIYLEKLGVPLELAVPVGIIWLIVPMGVYFGLEAAKAGSLKELWTWVISYAVGARVGVVLLMLFVSHFGLGTHFDNSGITHFTFGGEEYHVTARTWQQYGALIFAPQLTFWMGITLTAGVIFGLPTYWMTSRKANSDNRGGDRSG